MGERTGVIPLSLPRRRRKSPLRPNQLRMYQESEETHRTSMSDVSIPRWSICLKPRVRGKGSLTKEQVNNLVEFVYPHFINSNVDYWIRKSGKNALRTNPEKKKLTQPMISICGTMVTNWFFIPPIMPSIMAGSVRELIAGGAILFPSPSRSTGFEGSILR